MLRFLHFLLTLGLVLASSVAQARTLFIDFNNAESEIAVFKHSGKGKSTEVVVLPSYSRISTEQRDAVLQANAQIEKLTLQLQECAVKASSGKKNKDKCDGMYDVIRESELERIKATNGYSVDDLKAELQGLAEHENGPLFDMLVISGHHELGYYRGELTEAQTKQFADILKEYQTLFSRVNTVVLLGCGTGTKDTYVQTLVPMFPNVPLIFGAEDNAPTRNEARNLAYIRKLVSIRTKLLLAKTAQEVEPLFQSLLAKNWPVSLLWRQNTLFFKEGAEPLLTVSASPP